MINLSAIGSLNPFCGVSMGGIGLLRIIPVENVISIPKAQNHIIGTEIELVDGQNFLDIFFIDGTGGFKEPMQDTDQGEFFKPNIQVFVGKDTPDVAYWISRLVGVRCLALYQDNNVYSKLVGSLACPLTFKADLDTGSQANSRSGHTLTFSGDTSDKAYFYLHYEVVAPGNRKVFSSGFSFGFRRQ